MPSKEVFLSLDQLAIQSTIWYRSREGKVLKDEISSIEGSFIYTYEGKAITEDEILFCRKPYPSLIKPPTDYTNKDSLQVQEIQVLDKVYQLSVHAQERLIERVGVPKDKLLTLLYSVRGKYYNENKISTDIGKFKKHGIQQVYVMSEIEGHFYALICKEVDNIVTTVYDKDIYKDIRSKL